MIMIVCNYCRKEMKRVDILEGDCDFCSIKCENAFEKERLSKLPKTINIDLYLHSSKESNYERGKEAGLGEEALKEFMYTGYEEKLTYSVNTKTGKSTLIKVNDMELK